jgi:hypothetical protein
MCKVELRNNLQISPDLKAIIFIPILLDIWCGIWGLVTQRGYIPMFGNRLWTFWGSAAKIRGVQSNHLGALTVTNNGTLPDIPIETIAETPNYTIWTADEPDDEKTFHLELGPVTAHFFTEEWQEFVELIREAAKETQGADGQEDEEDKEDEATEVELDWGTLYFVKDEWQEFLQLIEQV